MLPARPFGGRLPHGHFDVISVSAAASTGIMDLRNAAWRPGMLGVLASQENRRLALSQFHELSTFATDRPSRRAHGQRRRPRSGTPPVDLSNVR